MKESFSNQEGIRIVEDMIGVIQENKQYLSDIDGAIGDGDHGINMNKGFTMCAEQLASSPGDLSQGLKTLSSILMMKIGGSMGPLYGMLYKAMAKACEGKEVIDGNIVGDMLARGLADLQKISDAKPGDKTLMDCLVPAEAAYRNALDNGASLKEALGAMKAAAETGKNSTEEMVAKKGRSSRLGERSRGVIDAGAASCCLLLSSMADSIDSLTE
ncbi:MAG: dihydroxyacetone kinase subunit L [Proteobacteria bacterium]|nr:dihydroxyacetone kinase subunit L [Pseudomonadota bacterium]